MKKLLMLGILSATTVMSWLSLPMGSSKSEVYQAMGEPITDVSGLKWVYTKSAVSITAHFDDDTLVRGFIIE